MTKHNERKILAKEKMSIALENFKQAEIEGAEVLAPVTYRWAKNKIYQDRKTILRTHSLEKTQEAIDDASSAAAQLLSLVRENKNHKHNELIPLPDLFDESEDEKNISKLTNEGGIVL